MNDSAVAAIKYALEKCDDDSDSILFLNLWNEGEFEVLRRNWENIPDEVFIDSDPLFKSPAHIVDGEEVEVVAWADPSDLNLMRRHGHTSCVVKAAQDVCCSEPLMTVAQHQRIVAGLRTEVSCANSRLHEVAVACATAEQERDAALSAPPAAAQQIQLADSRRNRVYLAGPMTGYAEFNFPAFNAEAARLRSVGFDVVNPADHGIVDGAGWCDYLRYDIAQLSRCESVHFLPGWEKSKGALLERSIAVSLGMPMTFADHATAAPPAAGVPHGLEELLSDLLRCGMNCVVVNGESMRDRVAAMLKTVSRTNELAVPRIDIQHCVFIGKNADGSSPVDFEVGQPGPLKIGSLQSVKMHGWRCIGPLLSDEDKVLIAPVPPASEQQQTVQQPHTVEFVGKTCQRVLMAEGKPYPRTCAVCGLFGPCKSFPRENDR